MQAYSIKEVSEKIDVPAGSIREWEKNFNLEIPRNKDNSRYYTEFEIDLIKNIKQMREKNVSKDMIREILKRSEPASEASGDNSIALYPQPDIPTMKQAEAIELLQQLRNFPEEMKTFFVSELKPQMIYELKKELTASSERLENHSEASKIKGKEERMNDFITQRRVNSRLEEMAVKLWNEKPESERIVKTGFLGLVKMENLQSRDSFVRGYINEHFEGEIRKEYDL